MADLDGQHIKDTADRREVSRTAAAQAAEIVMAEGINRELLSQHGMCLKTEVMPCGVERLVCIEADGVDPNGVGPILIPASIAPAFARSNPSRYCSHLDPAPMARPMTGLRSG